MKKILWLLLALLLSILFSCTSEIAPAQKAIQRAEAQKIQFIEKTGWELEWEKTLALAKKEGRLQVAMWASASVRDTVSRAFTSRYGIPVETISGSGLEMAEKVLRENKAGIRTTDMLISGTGTMINILKPAGILVPMEPELLLPEVKDPKVWHYGYMFYLDLKKTIFPLMLYPGGGTIFINTEQEKAPPFGPVQTLNKAPELTRQRIISTLLR